MWPLLGLAAAGFVLAARAKPKTRVDKRKAFGSRSGVMWDVEFFPEANLLVVHSPKEDRTVATFHKKGGRFEFSQGKGSPTVIAMMREDFTGEVVPKFQGSV